MNALLVSNRDRLMSRLRITSFLALCALLSGCGDDPIHPWGGKPRISPAAATIRGGDSVRFLAAPGISPGSIVWRVLFTEESPFVSYERERPDMVGENGWIRGYRIGAGRVIASLGSRSDTASVTVVPGPASTVAIGWVPPRLQTRTGYPLEATPGDRVGNATDGEIHWDVGDGGQIAVRDGSVIGLQPGEAVLRAGLEAGVSTDSAALRIVPFSGEWAEFRPWTSAMGNICALDTGGTALCLGSNDMGQLGYETPRYRAGIAGQYSMRRWSSRLLPVDTDVLFRSLAIGPFHSCGLGEDGLAYCWGDVAKTGSPEIDPSCATHAGMYRSCRFDPLPVSGSPVFLDISAGTSETCGVTGEGDVWCWGGELELLFAGTPIREIEGDREQGCGLSGDGRAFCWGSNRSGQLGLGAPDTLEHPEPISVQTELRFVALATGRDYGCGLTSEGSAYCWGSNASGQLGIGESAESCPVPSGADSVPCSPIPIAVEGGHIFSEIAADYGATCGVTSGGEVYCWGSGRYGQIGPEPPDLCGEDPCSRRPMLVSLPERATVVGVGPHTTCAGLQSGAWSCWGLAARSWAPLDPAG